MKKNDKRASLVPFLPDPFDDLLSSVFQLPFQTRRSLGKNQKLSESATEKQLSVLIITESVLREIYFTIGSCPAESGGPLGGSRTSGVVTNFHFDHSAAQTGVTYSPDYQLLNQLFADDWNPKEINLLGFVHSHPPGCRQPSGGDLEYAERILEAIPELDGLYLPIIVTKPDTGSFEIFPFVALRDGKPVRVERLALQIVCDEQHSEVVSYEEFQQNLLTFPGKQKSKERRPKHSQLVLFERVRNAYDLDFLSRCRIIIIGTGGAAAFIEDVMRAGVGQLILIDGDVVSETNLATQQTYRRDIGRPKVECIAERLFEINDQALIVSLPRWLDSFDDTEFAELTVGKIESKKPVRTLICGLTDNFEAQARINRLALQFGIPSLCAQVYQEGRGAEITFTYPGLTPACHRCILSSRYKAFLEQGYQNAVTSDGTPIFATTRLNAIKGFIALALLHHGTNHPRWGNLLKRIGNRNLVQIRMDPDFAETLGFTIFDRAFQGANTNRIFFDETIWLPMDAESIENGYDYNCPDCGGTGDLGKVIGTLSDTREMR